MVTDAVYSWCTACAVSFVHSSAASQCMASHRTIKREEGVN